MRDLSAWQHDHVFISKHQRRHEKRTRIVIGLTAVMMVLEVASGILFGSMALLADGWHMASHVAALGITALGYHFSRHHAFNPRFSFGTGKIGELAGYSSALVLGLIALLMAYESIKRFLSPVVISFDEAIGVACLGLVVNVVSALLLKERAGEGEHHSHHHTDHNIRAAYFHVLADALTSVLAIVALTAGRFLGWIWMDPFMGLLGAAVISRWSYFLLQDTGRILLDINVTDTLVREIKDIIESEAETRISDLHLWRIGPGAFSGIISLVTPTPRAPHYYKDRLSHLRRIRHLTVEVNPYQDKHGRHPN